MSGARRRLQQWGEKMTNSDAPRCTLKPGADPNNVFIYVNYRRLSIAAFVAMDTLAGATVDASGCAALTELKAGNAKTVYASGCTALTALEAPNAKAVYASGCAALTELKAGNAKAVDASGCAALTALEAPNAVYLRLAIDAFDVADHDIAAGVSTKTGDA